VIVLSFAADGSHHPFAALSLISLESSLCEYCLGFILISTLAIAAGQTPAKQKNRRSEQARNAELLRLQAILDQLILDARTLQDESARPEAMVSVGDAYWELDQNKGRELFLSALDLALARDSAGKDRDQCVRRILSAAARRDAGFVETLIKRLQDQKYRETRAQTLGSRN
jgi:hypothetical protein